MLLGPKHVLIDEVKEKVRLTEDCRQHRLNARIHTEGPMAEFYVPPLLWTRLPLFARAIPKHKSIKYSEHRSFDGCERV